MGPGSLALATPPPLKPEDSIKPVDTSSQVSIPDDMVMEIHASPSLWLKLGVQQWSSLLRCDPTPRGGKQSPGTLIGDQVFYWCSSEETSFRLWDDPSPKWVRDHTGHQGSKGPLCPHYQGCGDLLGSANKQSQSLACHLYQGDWGQLCSCLSRGRETMLNSYQGGRVPRHFPNPLNSTITCQRHSASRGRGHWRGKKRPHHLPHCLQYCPQGQPLLRPME